ncbi:ATP-binding protein [Sphingomonas nostoxanthinifaciens]|uniref:ATP-binding protein n=1 Tax=Sphingomonas nostoxanthinifaciens TaxID=2872652 RepID=UPI001CC2166E|nr:DUF87 domain-containing protein [Sphingomonas nostoxanthinifaciens]UAK24588.1 DUF87 domain-containing protein [Sphingomonas nostoxanthinifaciens]
MNAFTGFTIAADTQIGRLTDLSGAGAQAIFDAAVLARLDGPAGEIGSYVVARAAGRRLVAQVRALRLADDETILADLDFVGEGETENGKLVRFRRGVSRMPMPGCALAAASPDDLAAIFAADDRPRIAIGTVHPQHQLPATLGIDALLGRHFAILGSTGTGKSSTTALVLHRICDVAPEGHVLMIDPHGEYAASFKDRGAILDAGNLAIPYWLLNLDEHAEVFLTARGPERQADRDILAKCLLAARAKNRLAEGMTRLTVDAPIPYLLSDLGAVINAEMGKLDKAAGALASYSRLKARIEEVKADPRYAFMFSGMLVADSMADLLQRLLRLPGEGKPISIVDLSAVPSEITAVVVSLIARLIFDHALWSRELVQRPVLLVCEEAHRYIPAEGRTPARAVLERIAKEGRKYGVALGLVTQRPSDLAEGVLSQCGTIVAMRLNNERDQAFVRAAVPEGARGLIETIPALRNREAVVVGEGVALPIRVAFDTLEPERLPASRDPVFSAAWTERGDERHRLDQIIRRWRAQGRPY